MCRKLKTIPLIAVISLWFLLNMLALGQSPYTEPQYGLYTYEEGESAERIRKNFIEQHVAERNAQEIGAPLSHAAHHSARMEEQLKLPRSEFNVQHAAYTRAKNAYMHHDLPKLRVLAQDARKYMRANERDAASLLSALDQERRKNIWKVLKGKDLTCNLPRDKESSWISSQDKLSNATGTLHALEDLCRQKTPKVWRQKFPSDGAAGVERPTITHLHK